MTANKVLFRPTHRENISPGGEYLKDRGKNHRPQFHQGVDVQVGVGTPVYAAGTGTVIETGNTGRTSGHGLYARVLYEAAGMNVVVTYSHLSRLDVARGDTVTAATLIGLSGGARGSFGAGGSGGPHLHMEVRVEGILANPYEWLVSRTETANTNSTPIVAPPKEYDMTIFYKPTGNSSPLPNGISRIWAGTRTIAGIAYADVWGVADNGEGRRLTRKQWEDVYALYQDRGIPVPVVEVTGNQLEQIIYAPRY